jgi:hypothetical protein
MLSDFKEILSALNAHRVKYLIVGAYAVSIHAQPRATKDLDILVRRDPANAAAIFAALAESGAPLEGLSPEDLVERGSSFRMGREPAAVDILSEIAGVEFDAAWERRLEAVIEPESDLGASFVSRRDLLAAKLASVRAQDLANVEAIRKAEENQ